MTSIEGDVVTISSALGDLNGTLVSVEGDIATIKTDIGEILIALGSLMPPPGETSLWWILVAIVAILVVTGAAFLLDRGRRKSTGAEAPASDPEPEAVEEPVQLTAPKAPKRSRRKRKSEAAGSDLNQFPA